MSSSDNDTFEAWKCPECGNIQEAKADCEMCTFGEEEEDWSTVRVSETQEGHLVEVNG